MKRCGLWSATAGATAVEFALVAPFLMALMLGIIEGGLALRTQLSLQYGVEAAARCAAVDSTNCATTSTIASFAVQKSLGLSVPVSTFTVTTPACGTLVQASYTYTFITIFFGTPSVVLTAKSCFPK
jgi:Flp pilus assembly protein TadG